MKLGQEDYTRYAWIGLGLTLLIIVELSVYWLAEPARLARASAEVNRSRIAHGGEIYAQQCAPCHGSRGEGGVGPALNNRALLGSTPDAVLFSIIRSGVPHTAMPAWSIEFGGPLTDEAVRSVVALLRSWEPTAPDISDQQRLQE